MASAYFTMLLICFRLSITTVLGHPKQIPLDASKLEAWIGENMREFTERKAQLAQGKNDTVVDHVLAAAEDGFRVITVRKDGRGDFKTITDAVKSIPSGNTRRVVVKIGGGEYWEKITVERSKDFVTFFGDPFDMPKIVFNGTALHFGTVNSATVAVESDYFVAANVAFVVTFPFSVLFCFVMFLELSISFSLLLLLIIIITIFFCWQKVFSSPHPTQCIHNMYF